jgi:thiol:disulfide interchange protein
MTAMGNNRWIFAIIAVIVSAVVLSVFTENRCSAQDPARAALPGDNVYVTGELIANRSAVEPGKNFRLGVELNMQPGWHTYYKNPGDAGMATSIDWQLPPGFSASPLKWQRPHRYEDAGIVTFGYADKTLIAADISVPHSQNLGANLKFGAKVKWLSCRDLCVPGKQELTLVLPVVAPGKALDKNSAKFASVNFDGPTTNIEPDVKSDGSNSSNHKVISVLDSDLTPSNNSDNSLNLPTYLAFACLGGLILNFMPCVLPVVAIKVLGWVEQSQSSPSKVRASGLYYTAGVISSFLSLACIVIAAQAAGQKIGWGFQFQYPPFLIAMSSVVLFFGLSLFGLFNFNLTGYEAIGELAEKDDALGNFFKGVLATILSTPCTAPFLGTALGFAFVQPWWVVLAIFFAIGLGMSAPYFVLMINPSWLHRFPKPGAWMEKLKEFMGFILLATVAWLLSILGSEVGLNGMLSVTYFLLSIAFAAWFVSRFSNLTQSGMTMVALGLCTFILSQPCLLSTTACIEKNTMQRSDTAGEPISWQALDLAQLNKDVNSGKTVFLDFTAQWCLTCKANEAAVLNTQPIVSKMKALQVVPMRADWTTQDPTITKLLRKFNRSGVPLYVIFPAKHPDKPIVLPEVITQSMVLEKLQEAGPSI